MLKRSFDFTAALFSLIIFSPVLITLYGLIRWKLRGPAFFRQARPGLDGKPFELIKFRSMLDARDPNGHLLPDSDRLTSFGKFLRRSSLDELPELWNVLRGDMSLVGPRPLLMEYLPLYTDRQRLRHAVRPGLTGWAQINGRNALSWEKKFELDVWYVENCSFLLDMKILGSTIKKVIAKEGISAEGHATIERFRGNSQ